MGTNPKSEKEQPVIRWDDVAATKGIYTFWNIAIKQIDVLLSMTRTKH